MFRDDTQVVNSVVSLYYALTNKSRCFLSLICHWFNSKHV